jgi:hypothetical protein
LNDLLEIRLEKRHDTILQLGKLIDITLAAKHVMTDLREAGGCRESYVAGANH